MLKMDLFSATKINDFNQIDYLLSECGNDVDELNDDGLTAILLCASLGHTESAQVLIRHGADLAKQDRESGWSPLHRALYFGHITFSFLLIKSGAKLDKYPEASYLSKSSCRHSDDSQLGVIDLEFHSPLDLLSELLRNTLRRRSNRTTLDIDDTVHSSIMCFGKSDFILGVPLPNKACDVVRPRRIETLEHESIADAAASKYHSLALTTTGKVYSWGHGRAGRLGHSDEVTQPEPVLIQSLFLHCRVVKIACALNHSLAVTNTGDLYSWGSDRFGQLGHSTASSSAVRVVLCPMKVEALKRDTVVGIAAGESHSLCYTDTGYLYAWGSNKHHQLGIRTTELTSMIGGCVGASTPKRIYVDCLLSNSASSSQNKWIGSNSRLKTHDSCKILSVSASCCSSLLLVRHLHNSGPVVNEVYQWGHGIQFPSKVHFNDRTLMKRSQSVSKQDQSHSVRRDSDVGGSFSTHNHGAHSTVNIVAISAGKFHHVGLSSAHTVYTWGLGADQLGHGVHGMEERERERSTATTSGGKPVSSYSSHPQLVEALLPENGGGRVVSIAATDNRTCAVTDVGNLYTWGSTFHKGVLTPGPSSYEPLPKKTVGIKRAVGVAVGEDHTLVLTQVSLPPLPLDNVLSARSIFRSSSVSQKPVGSSDNVSQRKSSLINISTSVGSAEDGDEDGASSDSDEDEEESSLDSGAAAHFVRRDLLNANETEIEEDDGSDGDDFDVDPVSGFESSGALAANQYDTSAIPQYSDEVPSLKDLCQRTLARSVDVKTAMAALLMAECYHAPLLKTYCMGFIQRNFDAVLVQTKPSDIESFVECMCGSTTAPSSSAVVKKEEPIVVHNASRVLKINSRYLSTPAAASSATPVVSSLGKVSPISRTSSSLKDIDSTAEANKHMKALRKKVADISLLQSKLESDPLYALSKEQQEKVGRKTQMQADLAYLEQLMVRLQVREKNAAAAATEGAATAVSVDIQPEGQNASLATPSAVEKLRPAVTGKKDTIKERESRKMPAVNNPTKPPDSTETAAKSPRPTPERPDTESSAPTTTTATTGVTIPALAVARPSKSSKKKFVSLDQFDNQKQQYQQQQKATAVAPSSFSSWGALLGKGPAKQQSASATVPSTVSTPTLSSANASGRTVLSPAPTITSSAPKPPPPPPSPQVATTTVPQSPATSRLTAPAKSSASSTAAPIVTPVKQLPAPSVAVSCPMAGVDTRSAGAGGGGVSLADLLVSGSGKKAKGKGRAALTASMAPEVTPSKPVWGGAASTAISNPAVLPSSSSSLLSSTASRGSGSKSSQPVTSPVSKAASSSNTTSASATKKSSFHAIQAEEEKARQQSNISSLRGNDVPWLIERRPRAESLDEVIRQQAAQREEDEELQRAIERSLADMADVKRAGRGGNQQGNNIGKKKKKNGVPGVVKL